VNSNSEKDTSDKRSKLSNSDNESMKTSDDTPKLMSKSDNENSTHEESRKKNK
jgi:hypothetical protein